jgi:hypothetical protein
VQVVDQRAPQIKDTVRKPVRADVPHPLVDCDQELFLLVDRESGRAARADGPESVADGSLSEREPGKDLLAGFPADHDRLVDAGELNLDALRTVGHL